MVDIYNICTKIKELGGRAYFVGGYVRDNILGTKNIDDADIEVYNLSLDKLKEVLSSFGNVDIKGEKYGIYTLSNFDFAIPRKEVLVGDKHKSFSVILNPNMDKKEALLRRDFTINAILKDVLTGEIIDPFNGENDIKNKVLRAVNPRTFIEDSLRVLRGAQFSARFGFTFEIETFLRCKQMNIENLSGSRVLEESKKALLKSKKPSIFFNVLKDMGKLSFWFKELNDLIGVKQSPKYHKEGDAYTHTMAVLDSASTFLENVNHPLEFMLSALCHDFGKVISTEYESGKFHAYNHNITGKPLAKTFLSRLNVNEKAIDYVLNVMEYHMFPNTLASNNSSIAHTNKLFYKSVDPNDLIYIACADNMGKITDSEYVDYLPWQKQRLNEYKIIEKTLISGKELLQYGVEENNTFGEILEYVRNLQLANESKENAIKLALNKYKIKN